MRNPEERFRLDVIARRSQVTRPKVRAELQKFIKLGLIQELVMQEEIISPRRDKKPRVRKIRVYIAKQSFPFLNELRDLFVKASVAPRAKIFRQIKGIGKIKLAVISGVFIHNESSRTDLLLVGDAIQKRKLDRFLADTESELGKAIHHTVMETDEFQYRMDMYDRFLRDILEYPHEKLINKFNI